MNPLSLKATAIIGAGAAIMCLALLSWALWLRGDLAEARADLRVEQAQTRVLADSLSRCNRSVEDAKAAGDRALAYGAQALASAQANTAAVARSIQGLQDAVNRKPPAGASCSDAWALIEQEFKSTRGPR